ncbi:hypothetical protein HID58_007111 [Brassica napus]|uniref:Uncharacterized protein n=1 Tax=Brassica napus TaxID=3708 RepID=A0ABQ8EDB9_BRANA|nr:hypothetical protein HID58_007111 [Brassica napus]
MRSTVIGLPPYHVFSSEKLEDTTNDFGAASLFCEQLYKGCIREGIAVKMRDQSKRPSIEDVPDPQVQQGWTNTGNHEASIHERSI